MAAVTGCFAVKFGHINFVGTLGQLVYTNIGIVQKYRVATLHANTALLPHVFLYTECNVACNIYIPTITSSADKCVCCDRECSCSETGLFNGVCSVSPSSILTSVVETCCLEMLTGFLYTGEHKGEVGEGVKSSEVMITLASSKALFTKADAEV